MKINIDFKEEPSYLSKVSYTLECYKISDDYYHVEVWNVKENYHSLLPLQDEFLRREEEIKNNIHVEENTKYLSLFSSFRKGQKRYRYNKEEFFNKFNIVQKQKKTI